MASPPPTPNNNIAAPKSSAFGEMATQQSTNTSWSSPFGPLTSNVPGTPNTTGFGVQRTPTTNKETPVWSFALFKERDEDNRRVTQEYQTITFVDPYKNYSVEELRTVDYQQGRRGWGEFRPVNTAAPCKVEKIPASLVCRNKNTSTSFDTSNSSSAPLFRATTSDAFSSVLSTSSPKSIRIPTKKAMRLGYEVITIHVGDEEDMQPFTVHEALICTRSNFFRNALTGNWKEAQEKTVKLPEDDPTIFALYEQLLYSGCLPSESETGAVDDVVQEYATLCSLYVLSSKLQDVDAKRVTIDALLEMSRMIMSNGQRTCPLLQHIEIIYHGTHGPCAARRLMVDIYTYRASEDWLEKTFPPDFVFDLAKNVLDKRRTTFDPTLTCKVTDYYDTDEVAEEKL